MDLDITAGPLPSTVMLAALAGGVGAARFLRGLVEVHPPDDITVVVNTGDDVVLHGLHVSPDVDTVIYTLSDDVNAETGWGLTGETWRVMDELERRGGITWFRLGDRDLATHLYRTQRLAEGASLSLVTAELARSRGLAVRLLPMSDQRVETRVVVDGQDIGFQEYFVERRHAVAVERVTFAGIEAAKPADGVLEAIASAETVIVCPSNPIVSIGPIVSVPGMRDALVARRDATVAISPIVAGAALKGPADRMMTELGMEASVVGVARLYAPLAHVLVVDDADADRASEVEAEGMECVVAPTIMSGRAEAAALARTVLSAAGGR
jgi:LPPG:FO 2-phospho-L-lactate transferase